MPVPPSVPLLGIARSPSCIHPSPAPCCTCGFPLTTSLFIRVPLPLCSYARSRYFLLLLFFFLISPYWHPFSCIIDPSHYLVTYRIPESARIAFRIFIKICQIQCAPVQSSIPQNPSPVEVYSPTLPSPIANSSLPTAFAPTIIPRTVILLSPHCSILHNCCLPMTLSVSSPNTAFAIAFVFFSFVSKLKDLFSNPLFPHQKSLLPLFMPSLRMQILSHISLPYTGRNLTTYIPAPCIWLVRNLTPLLLQLPPPLTYPQLASQSPPTSFLPLLSIPWLTASPMHYSDASLLPHFNSPSPLNFPRPSYPDIPCSDAVPCSFGSSSIPSWYNTGPLSLVHVLATIPAIFSTTFRPLLPGVPSRGLLSIQFRSPDAELNLQLLHHPLLCLYSQLPASPHSSRSPSLPLDPPARPIVFSNLTTLPFGQHAL